MSSRKIGKNLSEKEILKLVYSELETKENRQLDREIYLAVVEYITKNIPNELFAAIHYSVFYDEILTASILGGNKKKYKKIMCRYSSERSVRF